MSGRMVAKNEFARHLRQVADTRETGFFTIVTDSRRSVLLRVSAGRITSSHCRGRDIDEAIAVLAASREVRYTFATSAAEDKPELVDVDVFLRRIDAFVETDIFAFEDGQVDDLPSPGAPATPQPLPSGERGGSVRGELETIAVDFLGPVGQVVVDDALADNSTLRATIGDIASSIPDDDVRARFLVAIAERFPDID